MLSNNARFRLFLFISILGCAFGLTSAHATAGAKGVCAVRQHEKVQQIDIFDGKPEELAYLAPDDNETAPNTFTLKYIYDKGGFVTIRCKYDSGFTHDVELKNKVNQCRFSRSKSGNSTLICK